MYWSSIQFRKIKTTRERKELDDILFTCLQLFVSITSAYISEKQLQKKQGMLEEMQNKFFDNGVHKEVL